MGTELNEYSYSDIQTHRAANCKSSKLDKRSLLYNLNETTIIIYDLTF